MNPNTANTLSFTKRISGTTYRVTVYPGEHATDTFESKILRLIQNEALDFDENCGMIQLPQMSRQSERSA